MTFLDMLSPSEYRTEQNKSKVSDSFSRSTPLINMFKNDRSVASVRNKPRTPGAAKNNLGGFFLGEKVQ